MSEAKTEVSLKKAIIVSRLSKTDRRNQNGGETGQKVTVVSGKGIQVERYTYDADTDSEKLIWKEKISDDPQITEDILDTIEQDFSEYSQNSDDGDNWQLDMTDRHGKEVSLSGYFNSQDLFYLSEFIRNSLGDNSLFLFDGNPDRIDRIEISYQRQTKIPTPAEWDMNHLIWDYHEQIIIDRASETIEYDRFIAEETDISTKYHVGEGISDFLDDYDVHLFSRTEGNPEDVYEDPMESQTYQIKVITKNEGAREISGSFDQKGLPMDFAEFMDDLKSFMDFYGHGEMIDETVYGHVRRRKNELIFCNVEFERYGATYTYLTDNDHYRPDDLVVVPAGAENQEKVARIVSIEYHTKDQAPYPLGAIKKIIRPFDEDTDEDLMDGSL